jgi:membrane-associated phospholipid phosphatase
VGVTVVVLAVAAVAGLVGFVVSVSQAVALEPQGAMARHPRLRRFLRERFDRDSRRGFLVTAAFAIAFVVALVVGGLLDMVNEGSGLAELDDDVAEWGSTHASSSAVDVLRHVTDLGGTPVVAAALVATGIVAYRRLRRVEPVVMLAAVGVGQLVLCNLIKAVVDRDRPHVLQLVDVSSPSFPSGHSTAAAACWAAVAFVLGHDAGRGVRAGLASAAVVIAVAVATSRALLGVHWLTDIVAGLVLGWGWFALVLLAFRTRERTVSARQGAR